MLSLLVIAIDDAVRRFGFSGVAFAICVAVIATGFAVRTWVRNLDWTDNKTMATAGVQTSPRSFKFHRLLAAQLLATDPSHRAAAEADRSNAILTPPLVDLDLPGPLEFRGGVPSSKGRHGLTGQCPRAV